MCDYIQVSTHLPRVTLLAMPRRRKRSSQLTIADIQRQLRCGHVKYIVHRWCHTYQRTHKKCRPNVVFSEYWDGRLCGKNFPSPPPSRIPRTRTPPPPPGVSAPGLLSSTLRREGRKLTIDTHRRMHAPKPTHTRPRAHDPEAPGPCPLVNPEHHERHDENRPLHLGTTGIDSPGRLARE